MPADTLTISADATGARQGDARAPSATRRFELVVLALFALLVSVVSAYHEPWKDETQAWRLAIDSHGLRELVYNARYEGHPLLWHVMLQLLGHLSRSWWAVAALHVAIACAGAWLVLRYAPFTRLQRVLLVFGYWSAYEYAVVVRPYGLGMMLAFAACISWTASRRRVRWTVLWLVLLANTTVIGTLLAMTMALAFAIDWAFPDDRARQPSRRRLLATGGVALVATLALLLATAAQVKPPADAGYTGDAKFEEPPSKWDLATIPTYELRALTPVVVTTEGVEWSRWLFRPDSRAALGAILVASLVALAAGAVIASRRTVSLVCFVVGSAGYLLFFGFFITGTMHHHGYLFVVWVVAAWLARSGPPTERLRALAWLSARIDRVRSPLFTASLVVPVLATIELSAGDLAFPFADSRHVGEVLRARGLADAPLIAVVRSDAQAVGALMDRPVIFPVERATRTFVVWGKSGWGESTAEAADSTVTALLARECRVVVIATTARDVAPTTARRATLIYATQGRPMSADRYRIWLATSPDTTRCPGTSR